jgi:hypothetical protein
MKIDQKTRERAGDFPRNFPNKKIFLPKNQAMLSAAIRFAQFPASPRVNLRHN